MALTDAKINYVGIRDSIIDLLRDNKSTINTNLNKLVINEDKQIRSGSIRVTPSFNSLYPMLFVKWVSKSEDWTSIGKAGRKLPRITYRVYCITQEVSSDVDKEIMYLTSNVESIFRDNIQFPSTYGVNILYIQPTAVETDAYDNKSVWTSVSSIDLECLVEVK